MARMDNGMAPLGRTAHGHAGADWKVMVEVDAKRKDDEQNRWTGQTCKWRWLLHLEVKTIQISHTYKGHGELGARTF